MTGGADVSPSIRRVAGVVALEDVGVPPISNVGRAGQDVEGMPAPALVPARAGAPALITGRTGGKTGVPRRRCEGGHGPG